MNERETRLFTLEPGMEGPHLHVNTLEHTALNSITLPVQEKNCLISPLASPLSRLSSIDTRLQRLLKPTISDMSVLKPRNFYALATDTYRALSEEVKTALTPEAEDAVNGLLTLLEENMTLLSIFMNNLNMVHKI
jgi:hypothetical protein